MSSPITVPEIRPDVALPAEAVAELAAYLTERIANAEALTAFAGVGAVYRAEAHGLGLALAMLAGLTESVEHADDETTRMPAVGLAELDRELRAYDDTITALRRPKLVAP